VGRTAGDEGPRLARAARRARLRGGKSGWRGGDGGWLGLLVGRGYAVVKRADDDEVSGRSVRCRLRLRRARAAGGATFALFRPPQCQLTVQGRIGCHGSHSSHVGCRRLRRSPHGETRHRRGVVTRAAIVTSGTPVSDPGPGGCASRGFAVPCGGLQPSQRPANPRNVRRGYWAGVSKPSCTRRAAQRTAVLLSPAVLHPREAAPDTEPAQVTSVPPSPAVLHPREARPDTRCG